MVTSCALLDTEKIMNSSNPQDLIGQQGSLLPTFLVTGFLGSGKTTFLNWLLSKSDASKVAVIVNEFGEIGLDHLLIATPVENIMLIEGGCLCCEVRGDLVQTLTDLRKRRDNNEIRFFDKVVIETTGLSNPVPIIQTLLCDEDVRDTYQLSKIITTVDVVNAELQMEKHAECIRQTAIADLLLLTKIDLATPEMLDAVKRKIKFINPGADQIHVVKSCPQNISASDLLSGETTQSRQSFLDSIAIAESLLQNLHSASQPASLWSRSSMTSAAHQVKSLGIESFVLRRPGEIDGPNLVIWLNLLSTLKGERLLRLKAILNVEGRPIAIHAAQTVVHEPVELSEWPSQDRDSRFVVISQGSIRTEFEQSLALLDFQAPTPQDVPTFDPKAYQQFLRLAEAMSKASA